MHLSDHLYMCICVSLFICFYLTDCLSIGLSVCLCVHLGVVSPYRAQVRLIKDLLAVSAEEGRVLEYPINDMKINTRPPHLFIVSKLFQRFYALNCLNIFAEIFTNFTGYFYSKVSIPQILLNFLIQVKLQVITLEAITIFVILKSRVTLAP